MGLKYGADKVPWLGHCYTPFYYEYLKPYRYQFKKILEVGVGDNRMIHAIPGMIIGASIHMWRDFFPNAMIYGADKARECIIEDERIKTFYCDENKEESIENLVKQVGSDVDLVIDDALHHIHNQIFLFKHLMPLLKKDVIYICEDCMRTRMMVNECPGYDTFVPRLLPNESHSISPEKYIRDGIVIFKNK
jgi:8-demethyl-8-alpha-L-rhamnosyltetracenomycin-C 2'-O-methyltransferase